MNPRNFFAELKRRNVIRMAGLYLVGAWLLIQVVSTMLPAFDGPTWVLRGLIVTLAVGFIPALIFSWVFELTPEGLKRDEDVQPEQSIGPQTARRMDRMIIAVLMLALAYFCVDKFVFMPQREAALLARANSRAALGSKASPSAIESKSIAVLPFENLSAEKENAYFVEGIQDEILTRLAKISALKVISRTSTMRYASRPDNLREIGRQLGVATILEGSVQRAEGSVRVNLQLIDAASDTHLWAETYDRETKKIFSVESEVAQSVADALKAKLLPTESVRIANVPTKNPAAYDLFLKGKYFFNQLQTSSVKDPVENGRAAAAAFGGAIAADPNFALAYALRSYFESYLQWYGVDRRGEVLAAAQSDAERALALQPDLGEAHLAMGYVHYWGHRAYDAALRELDLARASLPNNADVLAAIGYVHRRQGGASRGIPEMQQAMVLDPRDSTLPREIANSYTTLRRYAEAETYYARSLALVPDDTEAIVQRTTNAIFAGDMDRAAKLLADAPPDLDPQGTVSLARFRLALKLRQPDQALAAIAHSPAWLMTRWEHSLAPTSLLRAEALALKGETGPARAAYLEAEKQLQPLLERPNEKADAQSYLGLVYAGLGQKEAALQAGRGAVEALPMSRDPIVGAFYLERLARTEAQVGETASALEHLDVLMSQAGGETVSIATLRIDPVWDPLRGLAAFQALLAKYATGARDAGQQAE